MRRSSVDRIVGRIGGLGSELGSGLGVGLLVLAAAGAAGAQSTALVQTGSDTFQRYCATCHGALARGDGPVAPTLDPAPPDLTAISQRRNGEFPSAEIASIIDGRFEIRAHGTRAMPVWGRLLGEKIAESASADEVSRGRIDALVSYLQSIQR